MAIYAKLNTASWRMGEGEMTADEYIYTGELSEFMAWDGSLSEMRPMTQAEIARAAIPSVSIRQMHTALHRVGLLAPIKEYIAAANDIELEIAFASPTFERSNALIGGVALAMGKTDDEVDAIFVLAASI